MSLSLSSIVCKPCLNSQTSSTFLHPITRGRARARAQAGGQAQARGFSCKCELNEQSLSSDSTTKKLGIGTPVIIVEAPKMIKTAASVPCLRLNAGLVNPGDVGRIVTRKPMDVWAVRLNIGTYLIDRKYFKPLELDE